MQVVTQDLLGKVQGGGWFGPSPEKEKNETTSLSLLVHECRGPWYIEITEGLFESSTKLTCQLVFPSQENSPRSYSHYSEGKN
jgi:hypothetical protein